LRGHRRPGGSPHERDQQQTSQNATARPPRAVRPAVRNPCTK
jgi:hypothetical protein